MSEGAFSENADEGRFEYVVDGQTAYADCRREDDTLYIDFVYAPDALRGTGAAGRLMRHVVNVARAENLEIVPICGYAAHWIRRNVK